MSILKINFDKSFVCNNPNLTDILSKTKNTWSMAIRQSEVQQLEKNKQKKTLNLQYGNLHRHDGP